MSTTHQRSTRYARAALAGVLAVGLVPGVALAGTAASDSAGSEGTSVAEAIISQQEQRWELATRTGNLSLLNDSNANDYVGGDGIELQSELPSAFDLRDQGVITPVKFQNPWGTCWGFAAIAAAEASILSELDTTYDETRLDLSERQLAWFSQTALPEDAGSQAGEGNYAFDPDPAQRLNTGGMPFTATSIFSQGIGPISEEEVPYRNNEGITVNSADGTPLYYSDEGDWSVPEELRFKQVIELEGSNILPSPAGTDDAGAYEHNEAGTIAIKNELMEGRAVQIAFKADQSLPGQVSEQAYMNPDTWAHYTYEPVGANHAVTIVGWDDDYSKGNFTEGHQPPADGAWIVKNSWGSDSEEFPNYMPGGWGVDGDGYFYLSYYDQTLASPETLDFFTDNLGDEREMYYANAHDYLPISSVQAVPLSSKTKFANVFEAEGNQLIRTVATETAHPNTAVTYEVYLLRDGAAGPTDDTLVATAEDTYEYGGFHRTELAEGVAVEQGKKFSVVVEQKAPDGSWQMPLKTATNREGAEYLRELGYNIPHYAKGVINEGESYLLEGDTWEDFADAVAALKEQAGSESAANFTDYDNFPVKVYSEAMGYPSSGFADVDADPTAWYVEPIAYVSSRGIMNGYEGTNLFGVHDGMVREDMACMLFNYLAPEGIELDSQNRTPFEDVPDNAYYTGAVNWCYESGVIEGYTDAGGGSTTFGVGDSVTREMFATVLYRVSGSSSGDAEVVSVWPAGDQVSPWAAEALGLAIKHGIVHGVDGEFLCPLQTATRAEVAAMVMNRDQLPR